MSEQTAMINSRQQMVERQIRARGIRSPSILKAMRAVPREEFVPEDIRSMAYDDSPLPIEAGQTISQPYIVALMIDAADIQPNDRVLEVGAGSGYAAAVAGQIAKTVYAIERHSQLAKLAAERMQRLNYNNVTIKFGDGSNGWLENSPFDVILVPARAAQVPKALKNQLSIGGRLIIPIGDDYSQSLLRIERVAENDFKEKDLGTVRFVPLVSDAPKQKACLSLPQLIAASAEPLPDIDDPAFAEFIDRFADRRIILLGEASHGTAEFYQARAAITRRLITHHGFTIVAVEADWPDAAVINRHIRGQRQRDQKQAFTRFPTWMWRNEEMATFIRWLAAHNVNNASQTGFYGLDLYNLNGSIRAVVNYLQRVDPATAAVARERYGCLQPWVNDPSQYGRLALNKGYAPCEKAVVDMLRDLLNNELEYAQHNGDAFFDATQNARLVRSAEAYYRAMYYGSGESWNLRDRHMFETLEHLLTTGDGKSKVVVWAHNSHIGDARHTDMGRRRQELNIGQLCRERFNDDVALIGFGTHGGTVAAASDWDGAMEVKTIVPSLEGSFERLMHDSGITAFALDLRASHNEKLHAALSEPLLERYIGVIYRPESERHSHYSFANLARQFDAYVWFDETHAVNPLPTLETPGSKDTFPHGL